MALERWAYTLPSRKVWCKSHADSVACKRVDVESAEVRPWGSMELPHVQILVVVANIQVRTLKTDVEKGSMWTAVEHGSGGPKWTVKHRIKMRVVHVPWHKPPLKRKGIGLIFPTLHTEIGSQEPSAATQTNSETSARVLERVLFSLLRTHNPWNQIVWRKGWCFCKAPRFLRCPVRARRPLKIRERWCDFRSRPYPYPQQVSKVNSL